MSCLVSRNIDDLLEDINNIKRLAENDRLDGWTQNYYREKLLAVKKVIDNIDEKTLVLHG